MDSISQSKAEEIFKGYADYVFKTAYILTHSQFLADDILQESFIRIFKNYDAVAVLYEYGKNDGFMLMYAKINNHIICIEMGGKISEEK